MFLVLWGRYMYVLWVIRGVDISVLLNEVLVDICVCLQDVGNTEQKIRLKVMSNCESINETK